jgi:hypothetical protein
MKWANGKRFEGNFENDKIHGHGMMESPDGKKYVGNWANDKKHGNGTLYSKDGSIIYSGVWENGKRKLEKKRTTLPL